MYFNRPAAKLAARNRLKAEPSMMKVTLVFLLLTTVLCGVIDTITGSGMTDLQNQLISAMNSGDLEAMSAATDAFYSSNSAMIMIFSSLVTTLYCAVMEAGYTVAALKYAREQGAAENSDLSEGLPITFKIILLEVLKVLFIYLWSLLLIFPGIIAAYRYRMSLYILMDHPEISPLEAIRRSKLMMFGKKWELFLFDLSFLGWELLQTAMLYAVSAVFSFGTALIPVAVVGDVINTLISYAAVLMFMRWLTAYMKVSEVYFYDTIRTQSAGMPGGGPQNNGWNQPQDDVQDQNNSWNPPQDNSADWNDDPWN